MRILLFIVFLLLLIRMPVYSQEFPAEDQLFSIDTPVSLDFGAEEEPVTEEKKKKKKKKKVFYGIKTKKAFTRSGYGNRITTELFYYLKKSEAPKTDVRDIYWFDYTRKEIRTTTSFDPKNGVLLHGPYEKRLNDVVIEKGIFYKGTKHGRWMTYSRDSVLLDKEKYFRGWPKESMVTYYDPATRERMKEIIPIEYGEKEGYYYKFHPNGRVAVKGEYHWDHKVGIWTEYYDDGRRKREIAYPEDPFEDEVKPFVRTEWNKQGREIYRYQASR